MGIQEIIQGIRGTEKNRAAVVHQIYKDSRLKQSIKQYVLNHFGNAEDADILFDDMIVQFIKSVFSNREFKIEGDLSAYLMGIAKHLWFAESKKRMKLKHLVAIDNLDFINPDENSLDEILGSEKRTILQSVLDKIGKNCKEVLMYWANGFSMDEIASKLDYKSEGMVRKKKSICLKELIQLVQHNPDIKLALTQ
ncbi:MAG: sigma-70 family RNA polymerase sigma factor [Saprospiraceae bacterium]|nr:sigma-70 family RNA polymerase sigma factor [Saprospiraceae bacterium]MBK8485594.1 sigma-70 family RNA polymerase sigma factor [Saprospiraceae bacterium]MBK9222823.1 sigma-70 family RNA polymerase sigma factor [Saprospiraceae bacterium]